MPQRYLIAYVGSGMGLGNRLRVVLGGRALAESEHRRFMYSWPTGKAFGPTLSELWQISEPRLLPRVVSKVVARRYPYRDEHVADWLTDEVRGERVLQILTGAELRVPPGVRSWHDDLRQLEPVSDIASVVTSTHDQLAGAPYIGVQVRAHTVSHWRTKQSSPVEWFVERMHKMRWETPGVQFFLSCDVPEVQEQIVETFPGTIALDDKGPYNSTKAVQAAVADLYLLASSSFLLGPHFSSFIHLAQHLSGDALPIETPETRTSSFDLRVATVARDPLRPFIRS